MPILQLNKNIAVRHIFIWSLITIFLCFADPVKGELLVQIIGTSLIMLTYVIVYYAHNLFIFPLFFRVSNPKLIGSICVVFCVYQIIDYVNFYCVITILGKSDEFQNTSWYEWIPSSLILFTIIAVVAFGNYQNKMSMIAMKAQNEKEMALLTKELGFFKNQFNSHITFNFLNYCYGHMRQVSPDDAEVIEMYADLLRFTLNSKPDQPVPLEKEIDYINQYIKLKKRFDKGICIEFSSETKELSGLQILPRILITFVENAIKHGETHVSESPILIYLRATVNNIVLEVKNKKNKSKLKPISTGIGLQNVKEQLGLFYKNKYELIINEDPENYQCKLILAI